MTLRCNDVKTSSLSMSSGFMVVALRVIAVTCLIFGFWVQTSAIALAEIPQANQPKSFAEQPEKGWWWYREEKEQQQTLKDPKKSRKEKPKPSESTTESTKLSANDQIKKMREEFDEILAIALLNPTLENVTRAKNKQLDFETRSTEFSQAWVLSHILESEGYSHQRNPHPWHQELVKQERSEILNRKLKSLSKTYGLFFVFKQSCPYCHKFAPVVAEFAKEYGFEVKGISADGGSIEEIPNTSSDNGTLSIINPEGIYPALFLANPKTMEVIPIAWGMVTVSQLLNNLEVVLQQMELVS